MEYIERCNYCKTMYLQFKTNECQSNTDFKKMDFLQVLLHKVSRTLVVCRRVLFIMFLESEKLHIVGIENIVHRVTKTLLNKKYSTKATEKKTTFADNCYISSNTTKKKDFHDITDIFSFC